MADVAKRRRIYGASVIGIALAAGAFVLSDFGVASPALSPDAASVLTAAPTRVYIPVDDTNSDGVEDWREEFVTNDPIVVAPSLTGTSSVFSADTVTDQVAVQIMETLLLNRQTGAPFDKATFIKETSAQVTAIASDTMYTKRDILVVPTTEDSVRTYGNTMGQSVIDRNVAGESDELDILSAAVNSGNAELLTKLEPIAEMYRLMRDDALNTPVPEEFLEEHLVIINAYNAMFVDLDTMGSLFEDPIAALMRINRYKDDGIGTINAFKLMDRSMETYQDLFNTDSPVHVFEIFNQ